MTSAEIRRSYLDFFRAKGHSVVPSSSLLPDSPNLLFTNAGMNQFVPIFLGQAPAPRPPRAADTQKCIRAGGKHNDLEDVGLDTYHHTFFEMLGNWSFGDYFKKEAIAWAWELVIEKWKFPPSRLYATVYRPGPGDPAAFDQEAHDTWAAIFEKAGLDPAVHIVDGNKKDNFWMMGDTGPCGPCSELHVDLTPGPVKLSPARQKEGRLLVNSGDARCIEIWNLVFIQFNANPDGTFADLPARHVDTGMGFERVVSIIQGTKGLTDFGAKAKISNYETDVFRPLFDGIEQLTGKKYHSTLPDSSPGLSAEHKATRADDIAFRVIADHIRTLSFAIADGIQPSNEGRGYVLRRILRRAVRYGRNLGLREPFLGKLVPVLASTMGEVFPEVVAQSAVIQKTLTQEEESFFRTLERGIELFDSVIVGLEKKPSIKKASHPELVEGSVLPPSAPAIFPGADAFKLSDTYGFPLDLTELMARERGLTVDVAEFDRLMDDQKAKGKAAQKKEVITVAGGEEEKFPKTVFYGFDELQSASLVVAGTDGALVVAETPFYAEMGGQVGDSGEIDIAGVTTEVTTTVRSASGKVFFHKLAKPVEVKPGDRVVLRVDAPRRARIEGHHSATHLLHWALRKVLGPTVTQKGSYVGPDRLRFDFSHGAALTPEQIVEVEKLVNEKIDGNAPVAWTERPYADVKGDPSILQFFGDKYGDTVRVVSIGDFSRELCGGTHVRQTGKIGVFKIISEGAIAAGIRRIEAATGPALIEHVRAELLRQEEQYSILRQRKLDLAALNALSGEETPLGYWALWETREASLRQAAADVARHEKDEAKRRESAYQKRAAAEAAELLSAHSAIGELPLLVQRVEGPAEYVAILADALKVNWPGVLFLAGVENGKVALACAVAAVHNKKIQAGKVIQAAAPLVGGKGGGRPELAQGGGNDPAGIDAAFAKVREIVAAAGGPK
jgi:alanyl-tRNA synthetase